MKAVVLRLRRRWDPDLLLLLAALIVLLLLGTSMVQLVTGPLSRGAWVGIGAVVVLLLGAQAVILLTTRKSAR